MPKNTTTIGYMDVANALRETSALSMELCKSYSYATGLYESIIAEMAMGLSGRAREHLLSSLSSARASMQRTYGATEEIAA
jgi:hypothetical protein